MFYEIVNTLCKERKTTITKMSEEIGLSNAAATSWKKGSIPKASTLEKISAYFGVTTDYLLGKTDDRRKRGSSHRAAHGLPHSERAHLGSAKRHRVRPLLPSQAGPSASSPPAGIRSAHPLCQPHGRGLRPWCRAALLHCSVAFGEISEP